MQGESSFHPLKLEQLNFFSKRLGNDSAEIAKQLSGQMIGQYFTVGTGNRHSFHDIDQFPDVARPVVLTKHMNGFLGDLNLDRILFLVALQKMLDEKWNLFFSFTQRRNQDRINLEPVVQVAIPKTCLEVPAV